MGLRGFKTQKWLWIFALFFFVLLYFLAVSLPNVSSDLCDCSRTTRIRQLHAGEAENEVSIPEKRNQLAVIVPFRDRFEELVKFVPHMHEFLANQGVQHNIFIINQNDNFRFNRASLINVGFLHISSLKKFDYIAMHDVDLLPINPQLKYLNPGDGFALHIASPKLHPKYHYETFVGGILILTNGDFKKLNGLSNKYWGWGLEDDEFFQRMKQSGIKLLRHDNITDKESCFRHVHDSKKRVRDQLKCYDQKTASRKRDRITGLSDLSYRIDSISSLQIDSAPATLVNVFLNCNKTLTPWCSCP